ncbi:hypothetical protein HOY82DRAFT_479526, partial [Tuber indicum]
LHYGKFVPRIAYAFTPLTGMNLHKWLIRNIDTLEHAAGVPLEGSIEAHQGPSLAHGAVVYRFLYRILG